MDYSQYTATDLMLDASFRAWVYKTDKEACSFWDNWVIIHSDRLAVIEEARALLSGFRIMSTPVPEMEGVKRNIDQLLNERAKVTGRRIGMYSLTAVAASVLLISTLVYFLRNGDIQQSTAYATTRQVVLPDGSSVLLNANSTLHYKKEWKEREVWIEGEAFFTVTKKPVGNHPTFVVHANGLDVAVLGTAFNVYSRRNKVDVVLEQGKVMATTDRDTCTMHPGQVLHLDGSGMHLIDADPVVYTSWKQHRLLFTNTPLSKVAQVLEDTYGYNIKWKNKKRMQDTFTGSCPANNTPLLLKAISAVYNMKVTLEDNTITFE
jgi:transmembrane sensor